MSAGTFWLAVYRGLTTALWPCVFLYFGWRGRREPAYRQHWDERVGRIGNVTPGLLWIHAASVGEVALCAPLIERLLADCPEDSILLTTMTPTGRAQARARFSDRIVQRYLPLDTRGATRRFVRRARPAAVLFVETELWPNLTAALRAADINYGFINASMSQRSAARYARGPVATLMRPVLAGAAAIGAADDTHARRFVAAGASQRCVTATGNLKYDIVLDDNLQANGRALRAQWSADNRPLWTAASTHGGEETIVLTAFERIRQVHADALLVIAPRHPQRFDAVAALLAASSWRYARRSRGDAVTPDIDVVLADTLGEVPLFYAAADVVCVGGSFVPGVGGHNVIEAAASARPFASGAHDRDWRDVVDDFIACGAARRVGSADALAQAVTDWFAHPEAARAAGRAGAFRVAEQRGALSRSLALIEQVLEGR